MVSYKGKETKISVMATRILDENRAPKNNLKMAGDNSRKVAAKVPIAGSRGKSGILNSSAAATAQADSIRRKGKVQGVENAKGNRENSVKFVGRRKALADVSNLNNNKSNQHEIEVSSNPKIMKEKPVGLQSKAIAGTNTYRPRISLTKSVVILNASSKSTKENVRSSIRASGIRNTQVGSSMRRKTVTEISSCHSHQKIQNNQSLDSSKFIKNQGIKLSRPRLSFATQKALDGKTLSRKPIETNAASMLISSKLRIPPLIKQKLNAEVSINAKAHKNKVVREVSNSDSGDNEAASSRECSMQKAESDCNTCSSDNVKAIISKPKCNRRKSYTSSLVARSEVMGKFLECDLFKGDNDIDDDTNPLEVAEYIDDIYQYYWTMEAQNPLPANYMAIQPDITPRMRGILVNWLIEVHLKFQLMQETLFLMVQLLDRFLSIVPIQKDKLQIVGLTALLLASKYEDYWHPKINELISISVNLYTRDQILAMEKLVLRKLNFRLNLPTPYVFMLRFLKAAKSDKKVEHLAFYLIELCLLEYETLNYRPSLMCASAIYVARCTLQITPTWTELLRKHARYEESQLRVCAEMILKLHKAACLKPAKIFTYEKYLSPDRSCVSSLSALDMLPP